MNRLHETQQDFSRFVFSEAVVIPFGIKSNGFSAEQRLSIYRNNMLAGLTEALQAVYPVVNALLGDEFFTQIAHDYIRSRPPQSACLLTYGDNLAEFLAAYPRLQALPYLPDTARLEWACHDAYHAADGGYLDISELARLDAASQERLVFKLHPSARLITSVYPIARIWRSHQEDGLTDVIRLDEGGCQLLLYRPGWNVEIADLADDDYQFLQAIASGQTLTQAVEQVIRQNPEFDVRATLQHWLVKGVLNEFIVLNGRLS